MTPAHFKGMLFGNANRWQPGGTDDPFDPRSIWSLWASFGIERATLYGWWMERERGAGTVPVSASNSSVKVTAYVRKGEATIIVVASFLPVDVSVTLQIDWAKLGLPAGTPLVAPALPPMQAAKTIPSSGSFVVQSNQGWIFVVGKHT